ncbi:MAG: hypothetical protein ACLQU2_05705 [Candidatus Binataceae bacterium]
MRHLEIRLQGVVQFPVLAALPVNKVESLFPELYPEPGRVLPGGVNVEEVFDDDEIGLVVWVRRVGHSNVFTGYWSWLEKRSPTGCLKFVQRGRPFVLGDLGEAGGPRRHLHQERTLLVAVGEQNNILTNCRFSKSIFTIFPIGRYAARRRISPFSTPLARRI